MKGLSIKAKLYIITTILAGLIVSISYLSRINWQNWEFLIPACLAAIGQVFKVEGKTHRSSYNIAWLIYGFAFLLLGAPATLFAVLIAHFVEWIWYKYPWYIQSFNIASYALAISFANIVYMWINPGLQPFTLTGSLAVLVALTIFTLLNHLLVGMVIWLARGQDLLQSGVFGVLSLAIDLSLICLGAAAAMLWIVTPAAAVITMIPLYLISNSLRVPALERQTEIDPKTQLYNSRYFAKVIEKETSRADRLNRPMTVAIGDMDLLRNINNTYGHVAGDAVLCGIANILQESFRGNEVVARFGGEEFAILMPETTLEQAFTRVEAARTAIEVAEFEITTSVTPIKATMSFGIAGRRDGDALSPSDIIHNADVALYEAKLNGRNLTCMYSEERVSALFGISESRGSPGQTLPASSVERTLMPFLPNPLREKTMAKSNAPEKPKAQKDKPKPSWVINSYIGLLILCALALFMLSFRPVNDMDWFGLAAFALAIILTEGLSVNIYVKDTSVSTSAAPFIGGVLLFGPVGALVLSVFLAGTSMIKKRSVWNRMAFNTSNHLISSLMSAGLITLAGAPLISQPPYVQLAFAMAAGMIIFLCSTVLLSIVMGLSLGRPARQIWTEEFLWLWPFYMAFGVSAFGMVLGYHYAGLFGILAFVIPVLALRFSQVQYINQTKAMVNQLRTKNSELEKQSTEINTLNEELLLTLATIIDQRDPYTLGHSTYVSRYAVLIAKELGLSQDQVELIRKAALLHDIGKLGIPEMILFKPGVLTEEEYRVIKQHTTLGAEIVEACHSLHPLIPGIRHHHERYDGRGYPDGLIGQHIPLEARIIGLADALEAMASDRPYRKGLQPQEILQEITNNIAAQFDPVVVNALLKILSREGEVLIVNSGRMVARSGHAHAKINPTKVQMDKV